jgi:hypothetical protein
MVCVIIYEFTIVPSCSAEKRNKRIILFPKPVPTQTDLKPVSTRTDPRPRLKLAAAAVHDAVPILVAKNSETTWTPNSRP